MNAKIVKLRDPYRERVNPSEVSAIVSNVPIPTVRQTQQRYPLPTLQVGESFTVPKDRSVSLRSAVAHCKRLFPKRRFMTQTEGDRLRVWRTK